MRPITYAVPKQLIPVANKPVINYAFDAMREVGIKDIGIVVSDNRKDIEPALGDGKRFGIKLTYVDQPRTLGIAHAVLCAEEFIGKSDFMLYLGDNLLENGLKGVAAAFRKDKPDSTIVLKEVPDPTHFGVAEIKGGRIASIVEKPKNPKSNLAVIGVYIFKSGVFEAAKRIKPSGRGEYEITDTIAEMIKMGLKVEPHVLEGWWKDTGQKMDMIEANRALLDGIRRGVKGKVDESSRITGKVVVEKGAEVSRSRIEGPVVVGSGAKISGSQVGPYTAVGENVVLDGCRIENSIVMEGTRISGVSTLIESSLIGRDAVIEGRAGAGESIDLTIGDKCRVLIKAK